jgi:hypothetical protein
MAYPRLPNGSQSIGPSQSVHSRSRSTSQSIPSVTSTLSGRKRKNEHGEESSIKRRKASSEEVEAMNQSALYAAERMSDAIWISHAINLVIIGERS